MTRARKEVEGRGERDRLALRLFMFFPLEKKRKQEGVRGPQPMSGNLYLFGFTLGNEESRGVERGGGHVPGRFGSKIAAGAHWEHPAPCAIKMERK